jgi:hypothetical protein
MPGICRVNGRNQSQGQQWFGSSEGMGVDTLDGPGRVGMGWYSLMACVAPKD